LTRNGTSPWGVTLAEAERIGAAGQKFDRLFALIFARWVMVVVNFERLMYEDPSRDLDAAWWELVQKYQLLNMPEGRDKLPDWATKYHIALAPAYYQNYLLGNIMALQCEGWLHEHVGGLSGDRRANFCGRYGLGRPSTGRTLEYATGESSTSAFAENTPAARNPWTDGAGRSDHTPCGLLTVRRRGAARDTGFRRR
jgi:hypothetical protein